MCPHCQARIYVRLDADPPVVDGERSTRSAQAERPAAEDAETVEEREDPVRRLVAAWWRSSPGDPFDRFFFELVIGVHIDLRRRGAPCARPPARCGARPPPEARW